MSPRPNRGRANRGPARRQGYGGFQWPTSGPVAAPDWNGRYDCGGGLHGLPWGKGRGSYLNWDGDAKWMVVSVDPADMLHGKGHLTDKCKFRCGVVVFCGDRLGATSYIAANGGYGRSIVGGTATAGDLGIVIVRWWDDAASRYRVTVGYVGEDGIAAGRKYRCGSAGQLVAIEVQP